MKPICLDTHILIWGIKEESEPEQEVMVERAKSFLQFLRDRKALVFIPAVVVGELLTGIPEEYHQMTLNLINQGFIIPPYDAQASAIFAKIWRDRNQKNIIEELQKKDSATRQELKADCMIVATAIGRGADKIYSHDDKLSKFANGFIAVELMPVIHRQENFPLGNN